MKRAALSGIVLGLGIAGWTQLMGVTGWYAHRTLQVLFWVVVLIEVVILTGLARRVAAEGKGFAAILGHGLVAAAIGGTIAFANSFLFTTVLFRDFFDVQRRLYRDALVAQGLAADRVEQMVTEATAMQSPLTAAAQGFVGTVITGLFVSALAGALFRVRR